MFQVNPEETLNLESETSGSTLTLLPAPLGGGRAQEGVAVRQDGCPFAYQTFDILE